MKTPFGVFCLGIFFSSLVSAHNPNGLEKQTVGGKENQSDKQTRARAEADKGQSCLLLAVRGKVIIFDKRWFSEFRIPESGG